MIGELHEECAVAGAYLKRPNELSHGGATAAVYAMLCAQTNRGDLSSGIARYSPARPHLLDVRRGKGTPDELFGKPGSTELTQFLSEYEGVAAIGHNRYATSGRNADLKAVEYAAQPFLREHPKRCKEFAFCYNGNLPNDADLRAALSGENDNYHFKTDTDTELIRVYVTRFLRDYDRRLLDDDYVSLFADLASRFDGAYNIVFLDSNGTLAVCRDPVGFRPVCFGENDVLCATASESSALRLLGIEQVECLQPGELLLIDERGPRRRRFAQPRTAARCAFEIIYFMKSGSSFDGISVQRARERIGAELAKVETLDMDDRTVIAPVPKTAIPMRTGYVNGLLSRGKTFRLVDALILEGHDRTFIADFGSQSRMARMQVKFDMTPGYLEGQDVVLIDDSIVRGHTSRALVRYIREYGRARTVHVRVGAPPNRFPCYYGINMPTRAELVASRQGVEDVRKEIGADSLSYISEEALLRALAEPSRELSGGFCLGCFNGKYPTTAGNRRLEALLTAER
jgi:amidophosphoribosyltransferase